MNYDEGGGAIWGSGIHGINISYCCFYDNWAYYGSSVNITPEFGDSDFDLDHCTFWGDIFGYGYINSTLDVSNCIFTHSEYALANHANVTLTVEYSDFYDNDYDTEHPPAGFGVLDTVNYNVDSCDCYFNIFMDPMFADTVSGDLHLLSNSPSIDAGDPSSPLDPDGTIADQGCYYFNQIGVAKRQVPRSAEHTCYGATIFNGPLILPKGQTCKVFDITGREVKTLNCAPGIYFVEVDGKMVRKVIKIK